MKTGRELRATFHLSIRRALPIMTGRSPTATGDELDLDGDQTRGFPVANRDNHYEAAFEQYLRSRGVPYVAVDEAKRSLLSDGASIKSLDFIVSAPGETTWLVDVKGRRFPSGDQTTQYWKNWSPREDLQSLA
ncbi:MAG: HYExAFE family protein, partial [Planctomycetota bacterium]